MNDIHRYQTRLKGALKGLDNEKISEQNKNIILRFTQHQSVTGIGVPRRLKYLDKLRQFSRFVSKDLDQVTKEDIQEYVGMINNRDDMTKSTKIDFSIILKRFYKWLFGNDEEYPDMVKFLKTNLPLKDKPLPSQAELITPEEVDMLIDVADHPRNKAFVSLLYESGCRVGEIANLKIGNILLDQYGCVISVNGKTGHRRIRVVNSATHLTHWLEVHPFKHERNQPLWTSNGAVNYQKQINYSTVRMMLKKLFQKAKINKKCNPHIFRHARATYLANYMTEAQMKAYFGWVQHSDMASIYVHISGRDTDNAILKMHGLTKKDDEDNRPQPKKCPKCSMVNSHTSNYCTRCSGILDTETAIRHQDELSGKDQQHQKVGNIMELLMEDPDFKQLMFKKLTELKLDKLLNKI